MKQTSLADNDNATVFAMKFCKFY